MTKEKKKKKSKSTRRRKINISLFLSIVAIVISLGQLIFDNPYFLKHFNRVELIATELGISMQPNSNKLESSFLIENVGENPAKNVEIQLRVLKDSKVIFMPNTFELINPDEPKTPVRNLIYRCETIVPKEKIKIYVLSDFEHYLSINKIDTLLFNTRASRPKYDYGPYISSGKHSTGKLINFSLEHLNLTKLDDTDLE